MNANMANIIANGVINTENFGKKLAYLFSIKPEIAEFLCDRVFTEIKGFDDLKLSKFLEKKNKKPTGWVVNIRAINRCDLTNVRVRYDSLPQGETDPTKAVSDSDYIYNYQFEEAGINAEWID